MQEFLTRSFYGENEIWQWLVAAGVILVVWFTLRVLMRVVVRRFRRFASGTATGFDDLIAELLDKTRTPFILVLAFYAGSLALQLPTQADKVLQILFVIALLLQAGYWATALATFWIARSVQRRMEEDAASATSLAALGFVAKLAIWTLVVLVALDNMGVDITTLIAGLGISGIAIALAVQNILGDLFASLSIVVDKPFVIGDFIIIGELMGTVEQIGLKTTRVRSLSGEQIVFSNADLLSSRVRNYKRMFERRIAFAFGVTYDTDPASVEAIPGIVRQIIEELPDVRFDRSHFKSFGDFSLDFETVYYVLDPDFTVYMDRQQSINLAILRAFEARGIDFAFPTQTLYVAEDGPTEPPEPRPGV